MTPTQEKRKAMIDRIVNMLALADSTTHAEEAATAREMAGELMAKYSIEYTDINPDDAAPEYTEHTATHNPSAADQLLENAIGKFNGVFVVLVEKYNDDKYLRLIGTRENIDAHRYMMDMVKSQRQFQFDILRANLELIDKKLTATEKTAFLNGYAHGVNNKVWDILEAGNSKQQEWGLVVVDPVKAAKDWYKESHALVERKSRAVYCSHAGLESGRKKFLQALLVRF